MNIERKMIPDNMYAKGRRLNSLKWIVIHDTGNESVGANADMHARYLLTAASQKAQTSWHYSVDDKKVIQHLEDDRVGWHASSPQYNNNSIGIEICVNRDGDLYLATENAARLTAELLIKHGLSLNNIVQHFDASGKNCPAKMRSGNPYNFTAFKERVGIYILSNDSLNSISNKVRGL